MAVLFGRFVRVFAFAERMFAFCSRWPVGLNGCSHSSNGCFVQEDVQVEWMFVFTERCSVPVLLFPSLIYCLGYHNKLRLRALGINESVGECFDDGSN